MGVPFFEGTYREIEAQEQNWLRSTWNLHLVPPDQWDREYLTRLPNFDFNQFDLSLPSKEDAIWQWDRSRATQIYRHKLGLTPQDGFNTRLLAKDVTLTNFDFIQYIKSVPLLNDPNPEVVAINREKFLGKLLYNDVNTLTDIQTDPYSWTALAYIDNKDRVDYSIIYNNLSQYDKNTLDEYQRRKREGENYWSGGLFNSRAATDFGRGVIIVSAAVIGGAVIAGVSAPAGGAAAAGSAAGTGSAAGGTVAGGSAATAGAATSSGTLAGSTGLLSGAGAASGGGAASAGVLTTSGLGAGATATTGVTLASVSTGSSVVAGLYTAAQTYATDAATAYATKEIANALQPKKQPTSSTLLPNASVDPEKASYLAWGAVAFGLFLLIKKT